MAKHAHRLILNQKKTWKCTLPNCRYFIHIGLAHILPGQMSICWECGEEFELDERALRDDQPKCRECRLKLGEAPSVNEIEDYINEKLALSKLGVKSRDELEPRRVNTLIALGVLPEVSRIPAATDDDEPTSFFPDEENE